MKAEHVHSIAKLLQQILNMRFHFPPKLTYVSQPQGNYAKDGGKLQKTLRLML